MDLNANLFSKYGVEWGGSLACSQIGLAGG